MSNYMDEGELNSIKGLLHYLNDNLQPPGSSVAADVKLIDGNGDTLGVLEYSSDADCYVFQFAG